MVVVIIASNFLPFIHIQLFDWDYLQKSDNVLKPKVPINVSEKICKHIINFDPLWCAGDI